jgi:serine/threonine protein kinase
VRLGELDAVQSACVLALVDEALEREPADRERWLTGLVVVDPDIVALVRQILLAANETEDTLPGTCELVARHLAAVNGDDAAPGTHCGPYRLRRRLGHGGMGEVWLAERADDRVAPHVALKLVHQSVMSSVGSARVDRERSILAGLDHPHIARLLDAGFADDGRPYLALEYVDGTPLTEWCDRQRCTIGERLGVFEQVASAVQYAHANLVVHRDLKPANIFVTWDGQVKLLDFGIARLLQDGEAPVTPLTRAAGRPLTLAYASPEQIAGLPMTAASDVYSLGVVLYELLCGVRPYRLERETAAAIEAAILSADPIRPSQSAITDHIAAARAMTPNELRELLARDLDVVLAKALAKNPAERYATVDAFALDLTGSVRRGARSLARVQTPWRRFTRSVSRRVADLRARFRPV